MFRLYQTLIYEDIEVLLLKQKGSNAIYIPRECIWRALNYESPSQLGKMQLRYYRLFENEYIREFYYVDNEDVRHKEIGLYTLKGVAEVCSHTQKFRGADKFLHFLQTKLLELGIKDEVLEIGTKLPLMRYENSEREVLMQMAQSLKHIEKMLESMMGEKHEEDYRQDSVSEN